MRGFSDEKRERIRRQLVESGRELLLTYGPKKTNVVDITEPVGIAKSTFYLFFDSKAELYLEIIRREMEEYRENLRDELEQVEEPREGLELLFRNYKEFAENDPFIQQMVIQRDYREVFYNISPEQWEETRSKKFEHTTPFIETLQEQSTGHLAEHDPKTVLGVMGTIGLLVLHKDEFEAYGAEFYEQTQDLLITALSEGLTSDVETST